MSFGLKDLVPPKAGPVVATIFGEPGLGKTSLAAEFPQPVFLRAEDGSRSIATRKDVALSPIVTGYADVAEFIGDLTASKHPFKTLVFDSITELEVIFGREILARGGKGADSLATANGGYGKGYEALATMMGATRVLCENLRLARGMHIVFIAHSQTRTEEPPDSEAYGKYSLRLHKKCEGHFINNVDLVGFLRLRTFVSTDTTGRGKAVSNGERVLDVQATPYSVSKNRFGLTESLTYTVGANPLAGILSGGGK